MTDTAEDRQLAAEAARRSIVLLKNQNNVLPFDKTKLKSIAVIGPNADRAHLGGYTDPKPPRAVSVLDGIKNKTRPGEPLDKDIYDLEPEELAKVPKTPASLDEALTCLEKDQEFLLQGDVFTEDVISTWVWYKREKEVEAIRKQLGTHTCAGRQVNGCVAATPANVIRTLSCQPIRGARPAKIVRNSAT